MDNHLQRPQLSATSAISNMSVAAFAAVVPIKSPCNIGPSSSSFANHPFRLRFFRTPASRSKLSMTARQHLSASETTPIPSHSPTLICTSLTAPTVSEQTQQALQAASAGADLVEVRVDLLNPSETSQWLQIVTDSPLPVIVTNRPLWEGGQSAQPEQQRLSILIDAVRAGVSHIDVELAAFETFQSLLETEQLSLPLEKTRLILSHHNFQRPLTQQEMTSIINKMAPNADIAKIAMNAESALDNVLLIDTLRNSKLPLVLLAMGELGQLSRILAPKYGAYLTFASVASGKESAPGQVDTKTLVDMYRFRKMSSETPLFGVIGDPVGHSMSPALHNAALAAAELPGVYLPLKVEAHYPDFIRQMAERGFHGFSVTIPGKVLAMNAMNEIDPVARKIGAMNTVVQMPDGVLRGYNTDWIAAISAVEEQVEGGLTDKRVVCIGAGGAGRALAFGALERGARSVIVVNRTVQKAEALASDLGERASGMSLEEFNKGKVKYDVLMNSTSVGMHPNVDVSPVREEALIAGTVVFDAVYNPLLTKLLQDAENLGCKTVSGLEMFVRQAAEQFRLWFPGKEAPLQVMRDVVMERLSR